MTVEELAVALAVLAKAKGMGDKKVCMWPADIANMQLVDEIEYDSFHDVVILH